jgi:hypothetical protein
MFIFLPCFVGLAAYNVDITVCLAACVQLCGRLRSGQLLAVELLMTPDDPADFLSEAQLQEVRLMKRLLCCVCLHLLLVFDDTTSDGIAVYLSEAQLLHCMTWQFVLPQVGASGIAISSSLSRTSADSGSTDCMHEEIVRTCHHYMRLGCCCLQDYPFFTDLRTGKKVAPLSQPSMTQQGAAGSGTAAPAGV